MVELYKLTISGKTYGDTAWGPGITHRVDPKDARPELCTSDVIHAYRSPELAVLMAPIHTDYDAIWFATTPRVEVDDGTKVGVYELTTHCKLPLIEPTVEQCVRFGILAAREVYLESEWVSWAEKWLSGEDRTKGSTAATAAATAAAYAAASPGMMYFDAAAYAAATADAAAYAAATAAVSPGMMSPDIDPAAAATAAASTAAATAYAATAYPAYPAAYAADAATWAAAAYDAAASAADAADAAASAGAYAGAAATIDLVTIAKQAFEEKS